MAKKNLIAISRDGSFRAVYSPLTREIAAGLGRPVTRRASHVEPTGELSPEARAQVLEHARAKLTALLPGADDSVLVLREAWWADMLPSGGPVLGPFETREDALDAELKWLEENRIPLGRTTAH